MSDDDWGTLNIDRGKALGSEIATLRHRYIEHRNALTQLIATAPNETLEQQYQAIHGEILDTIAKLGDLEQGAASTPITSLSQKRATGPGTEKLPFVDPPVARPHRPAPSFAKAPLRSPLSVPGRSRTEVTEVNVTTRVLLIALLGVAVLTLLAVMLWKPWRPTPAAAPVVQTVPPPETTSAEPVTPPKTLPSPQPSTPPAAVASPPRTSSPPVRATPRPAALSSTLEIKPASWDYGLIRKGTRGTHKFQIVNRSRNPITVAVERSRCRCLWFDPPTRIPPQGMATLVVSVDAARATSGPLNETVRIVSRADPKISAVVEITATIQ